MTTPLEGVFSTDEKVVAQADLKLLGSAVQSLVVKFNQEKFEQLLSSSSISPKSTQEYHKVSSETGSQVSSEASQRRASSEANRTLFDKANGSTSLEVQAITLGDNKACDEVSQELARSVLRLKANTTIETNLAVKLLLRLSKLSLQGVRNNSC